MGSCKSVSTVPILPYWIMQLTLLQSLGLSAAWRKVVQSLMVGCMGSNSAVQTLIDPSKSAPVPAKPVLKFNPKEGWWGHGCNRHIRHDWDWLNVQGKLDGACTEDEITAPSSLSTMAPDNLKGGSSHLKAEIWRFEWYVLVDTGVSCHPQTAVSSSYSKRVWFGRLNWQDYSGLWWGGSMLWGLVNNMSTA